MMGLNILKCGNGHHFDGNKYEQCPYCKKQKHFLFPEKNIDPSGRDEPETVGEYCRDKDRAFVTGWLVALEGPEKGIDYRITYGWNWMGSSYDMGLCISGDEGIEARNHCAVVYDSKNVKFFLVAGRGTVTYLNGELLTEPQQLSPGDRITVGNYTFEFIPFCREGHTWNE